MSEDKDFFEITTLDIMKNDIPQRRVFDEEISPFAGKGFDDNKGMSDKLDVPLGELVRGIETLEKELGQNTTEKTHGIKKTESANHNMNTDVSSEETSNVEFKITPLARKIAEIEGVDLNEIKVSGSEITKEDVLAYVKTQKDKKISEEKMTIIKPVVYKAKNRAEEGSEVVEDVNKVKNDNADNSVMTMPIDLSVEKKCKDGSKTYNYKVPANKSFKTYETDMRIHMTAEVDMTEVKELKRKIAKKIEEETGARCTYTDFLFVSAAKALKKYPQLNMEIIEDGMRARSEVNFGMAISTEDKLLFPLIKNADSLDFSDMVIQRSSVVRALKNNRLSKDIFGDFSFSIINLGMYGILSSTSNLSDSNYAALSVGEVVERMRVHKGEPAVRSVMTLCLSLDQSRCNSTIGAKFLESIKEMMENPALLLF